MFLQLKQNVAFMKFQALTKTHVCIRYQVLGCSGYLKQEIFSDMKEQFLN